MSPLQKTSTAYLRLAALATLIGLATALTNPFLPLFVDRRLGAGPVGLAAFVFLSAGAALAACTVLGRLSDRPPLRRPLLVAAAGCGFAGYGLFALLHSYWLVLAASVGLASIAASMIPQLFACAQVVLKERGGPRLPLDIAALRTLFSVAWVAGPPLGALTLRLGGYPGLFAVVAGAYAAAALTALRPFGPPAEPEPALEQPTAAAPGPSAHPPAPPNQPADAHRPPFLRAGAAFVALQTAAALSVLALPLLLTGSLGADSDSVGLMFSLAAALEIPLMLGLGVLAARMPPRRLVLAGAAAGAGYCAVTAVSTLVWQIAAAQLLSALFVAGTMAVGISYFQDLAPDRAGFATSLYANASRIGSMLAAPLLGLAQPFGYRSVFLVAALLCGAGALLLASTSDRPAPYAAPSPA
jgi:SET family sugar efflux transporter-like MFS transporter